MQPGAYETYRSVRVFSALDGLRALAVLAVVWHHSAHDPTLVGLIPAARLGFLGVDLFFEISGFLIVTLLLRERERTSSISLKNFYARRTLRIFPLYYGLLAVASLFYFVIRRDGGGAAAFRSELWVMALYLSNWIHVSGMFAITWSLAAEEQFYLVWPPVEKWLARFAVPLVLLAIALGQIVHFGLADGALEAWFGWSPEEPAFLRQTTWTPICLGVLLAHALHRRSTYETLYAWFGRRPAAPLALLVLVALCMVLPSDIRGGGRLSVHGAMLLLLVSAVIREDNGLRRLLTFGALARIGALSYGIYLLHHIALGVLHRLLDPTGVLMLPASEFLLGAAASVGIAELSYRAYEQRFLSFRTRFR